MIPKQQRFVEEYLVDLNATKAAKRAGYTGKHLRSTAYQLLHKTRHLIESRKTHLMAKSKMSLDQWVETVSALALYDARELFDVHGNPTEIPELSRFAAMSVAGFEIEELYDGKGEDRQKIGYVRKYKLLDRTPYLLMLGKYLNAFPDNKRGVLVSPPPSTQFDQSKLTNEEWETFKRIRLKALVGPVEGG